MKRFFRDLLHLHPSYQRYGEKEDRFRRLAGQLLSIAAVIFGAYYLSWHFRFINWSIWYISVPFFGAEAIGWLLFTSFAFVTWYPRRHLPEGIPLEKTFTVDVFVCTCGEPLDILSRTLMAAVAIDYEPKTLYLLDDKADPEVAALAERFGIEVLSPTGAPGCQSRQSQLWLGPQSR